MRELLELQTGQVSFLSGLLAGFAMTAALHILRHGMRRRLAQLAFLTFVLSSLLFIVALYVDVRLTIELAGIDALSVTTASTFEQIRFIGTTSATFALVLFVLSVGLLGWMGSPTIGMVTTLLTAFTMGLLIYVWVNLSDIGDDSISKSSRTVNATVAKSMSF